MPSARVHQVQDADERDRERFRKSMKSSRVHHDADADANQSLKIPGPSDAQDHGTAAPAVAVGGVCAGAAGSEKVPTPVPPKAE